MTTPTAQRAQALCSLNLPVGTPPEIVTAVEDAVRDVLDKHGLDAFAMPQGTAIAHEAGHAIVATAEGLNVVSVSLISRRVPSFEPIWGGWCAFNGRTWTTGPDTSAANDLGAARVIIGGLAGEAVCGVDKPGSSIDELCLSQHVSCNAATKLADPKLTNEAFNAFAEAIWRDKVWDGAISIIRNNREPFQRLAELLHERRQIKGGKLRRLLAQIVKDAGHDRIR